VFFVYNKYNRKMIILLISEYVEIEEKEYI